MAWKDVVDALKSIAPTVAAGVGTALGGPAAPIVAPLLATLAKKATGAASDADIEQVAQQITMSPELQVKLRELAIQEEKQLQDLQVAQLQAQTALAQQQNEVNKIESSSPSKFKSWWRPAVGWTCCVALATDTIARPLAVWIATLAGASTASQFPVLDLSTLLPLLFGILGLGAYRSFDKVKGTSA